MKCDFLCNCNGKCFKNMSIFSLTLNKTRDLNENLLLNELDGDYFNAPKWVEKKYSTENEDYEYCVVREKIKLISDCINHNIPLYIDLSKQALINTKTKPFNICLQKQAEVKYTDFLWVSLFESDLNRNIKVVSQSEAINAMIERKKIFMKSGKKSFSRVFSLEEDFNNIDEQLLEVMESSYGKHWYAFEDYNFIPTVKGIKILKEKVGLEKYLQMAIKSICIATLGHFDQGNVIISDVRPFKTKNEFRCIFVGNKIHSISERIDYQIYSKQDEEAYKIVENYCIYLAEKYYKKVPYKIWNVDICLVDNKPEIVEAHLSTEMLGHFLYNQDYYKLFKMANNY